MHVPYFWEDKAMENTYPCIKKKQCRNNGPYEAKHYTKEICNETPQVHRHSDSYFYLYLVLPCHFDKV